jgi:hypothetical protein
MHVLRDVQLVRCTAEKALCAVWVWMLCIAAAGIPSDWKTSEAGVWVTSLLVRTDCGEGIHTIYLQITVYHQVVSTYHPPIADCRSSCADWIVAVHSTCATQHACHLLNTHEYPHTIYQHPRTPRLAPTYAIPTIPSPPPVIPSPGGSEHHHLEDRPTHACNHPLSCPIHHLRLPLLLAFTSASSPTF